MNVRRARHTQHPGTASPRQGIGSGAALFTLPFLLSAALSACGGGQNGTPDSAAAATAPTVAAQAATVATPQTVVSVSSVRSVGAPPRPSSGNKIETHPGVPPRKWVRGQDKAGDLLDEQPKHVDH